MINVSAQENTLMPHSNGSTLGTTQAGTSLRKTKCLKLETSPGLNSAGEAWGKSKKLLTGLAFRLGLGLPSVSGLLPWAEWTSVRLRISGSRWDRCRCQAGRRERHSQAPPE